MHCISHLQDTLIEKPFTLDIDITIKKILVSLHDKNLHISIRVHINILVY